MSIATTSYIHLAPKPKSAYKQLFVQGTRIRARVLYGWYASADTLTVEDIAAEYNIPDEALLRRRFRNALARPITGSSRARCRPSCGDDLTGFACPNEDCSDFNRFAAGNLRVCERMGKDHRIRRWYRTSCGHRFSERQGSLMARSKLPEQTVVRIVKCLGHGCGSC